MLLYVRFFSSSILIKNFSWVSVYLLLPNIWSFVMYGFSACTGPCQATFLHIRYLFNFTFPKMSRNNLHGFSFSFESFTAIIFHSIFCILLLFLICPFGFTHRNWKLKPSIVASWCSTFRNHRILYDDDYV